MLRMFEFRNVYAMYIKNRYLILILSLAAVPAVQEMSIEDCSSNEEFLSCGWCEPSCSEPYPSCSANTCTRGCLCRPPLLRHYTGQCVEQKDCIPRKCNNPNEVFVCRYGCEARCDNRRCLRPKHCVLGCHCKLGLLRDVTGHCVVPEKCQQFTLKNEIHNISSVPTTNHSE